MKKDSLIVMFLIMFFFPLWGGGQEDQKEIENDKDSFPVESVSLYSSGLAWMVHSRIVEGDQELFFPVENRDLNDILKSLSFYDSAGGFISSVGFDTADPLSTILSDMRINPAGSPPLFDFLQQSQGEIVEAKVGLRSYRGRIFSVEIEEKILNLIDDQGTTHRVDLAKLSHLLFVDKQIQRELSKALELISQSRLEDQKTLKISLKGKGIRTVRIAYIREVPLWKNSYRILVDNKGEASLEGWALVSNTGTLPWENVALSFVAGSPNAFKIDLATPRYVPRETLSLGLDAPIGSTSYNKGAAPSYERASKSMAMDYMDESEESAYGISSFTSSEIVPQASGEKSGNFYRYDLKNPVTVKSRSSAMIPILSEKAGSSIALYDPSHDLIFKGLRLTNEGEAMWEKGPVTVLEEGGYGGDAMLPSMIGGSQRYLTYAVHGSMELSKEEDYDQGTVTGLKIVDGLMIHTERVLRKTIYHISGSGDELILIHRRLSGWNLIKNPEIEEQNDGEYRFLVKEWEKPVLVEEEKINHRSISLYNMDTSDIAYYFDWKELSPSMEEALSTLSSLLNEKSTISNEFSALKAAISRLERDQNRIRENLKALNQESKLFSSYAEKMVAIDSDFDDLSELLNEKEGQLTAIEKRLKDFIFSLEME